MIKESFYYTTLNKLISQNTVDKNMSVLVVGGGPFDASVMKEVGFENFTISNIDVNDNEEDTNIDGTNLPYKDKSFDLVCAHATLHHMDKPHSCICEMYRVAKNGVLFVESQDSFLMKIANYVGLVQVYERNAIRDSGYKRGGVNDEPIPNYVYRWTKREVEKLLMSYNPKVTHKITFFQGWDFSPKRIQRRISEKRPWLDNFLFYGIISFSLFVFNLFFKNQGNLFAVFIDRNKETLKPWIIEKDGEYTFKDE